MLREIPVDSRKETKAEYTLGKPVIQINILAFLIINVTVYFRKQILYGFFTPIVNY